MEHEIKTQKVAHNLEKKKTQNKHSKKNKTTILISSVEGYSTKQDNIKAMNNASNDTTTKQNNHFWMISTMQLTKNQQTEMQSSWTQYNIM